MKREDVLIQELELKSHPEGGFYKETYRSSGIIMNSSLPENYRGNRNFSTSIYFLLSSNDFSAFHRINQDETWHFYEGSSITIHQISPEGIYSSIVLGNDILEKEVYQYTVKGGFWFGATVNKKNSYTLVGCAVAPGFDFNDFELATRNKLQKKFPNHKKIIEELTRL